MITILALVCGITIFASGYPTTGFVFVIVCLIIQFILFEAQGLAKMETDKERQELEALCDKLQSELNQR